MTTRPLAALDISPVATSVRRPHPSRQGVLAFHASHRDSLARERA